MNNIRPTNCVDELAAASVNEHHLLIPQHLGKCRMQRESTDFLKADSDREIRNTFHGFGDGENECLDAAVRALAWANQQ